MNRLFITMATLSTLLIVLVLPSNVSAVSQYDDDYITTDELIIKANNCTDIDVTTTWSSYLLEETPNNSNPNLDSSFSSALSNGRWAVSTSYDQVNVWWTEDTSLYVEWEDSYYITGIGNKGLVLRGSTLKKATIQLVNHSSLGCYVHVNFIPSVNYQAYNDIVSANHGQDYSGNIENYYLYTDYPNYPPDYDGQDFIDTREAKPQIRPDFIYQVNNKNVKATDNNLDLPEFTPDEGYTFKGYTLEWSLFECQDGYDTETNSCSNPDLVEHQIKLQQSGFDFDVLDYGDYQLQAQYLVEQCYRYPSYPATPDYCFYVDLETEFDDYEFTSTAVYLKIDGSTFSGSTKDMVCDVSGHCELQTNPVFDMFASYTPNTHGLQAFFLAPINFVATLPAKVGTCQPIIIPIFGQNKSLQCVQPLFQSLAPTILLMWQTVLNAVVCYYVAYRVFGHIKDVNSPNKDRIEFQKL